MFTFFASHLTSCIEKLADPALCSSLYLASPIFWLNTAFGKIVFIMTFLTWGLLIVVLALLALYLVHLIFGK